MAVPTVLEAVPASQRTLRHAAAHAGRRHLDHDQENENARLTALCVPCHRCYDNRARAGLNAPEQLPILYLWNG